MLPVPEITPVPPVLRNPNPVTLPLALIAPATFNPVGVNTATLPTPLTPTVTLPLDVGMATLLVPLLIVVGVPLNPVSNAPLPMK